MAKQALIGGKTWFDSYDISTWMGEYHLNIKRPLLECTGQDKSGIERMKSNITDVEYNQVGYGEDGDTKITGIDWNAIGTTKILSVSPIGGAVADNVYFTKVTKAVFKNGGKIGGAYPFAGAALGNAQPCILGKILASGAKTSTAAGTGQQLGAVAVGQKIYGCVHCTANTSGGDHQIVVKIKSCATVGGTYTDRITFTTLTPSVLVAWGTPVDGEITDTYWQAQWTISGSASPSFTIHVMAGIL